jgi:thiol:disulfide interchange protein
MKRCIIFRPEFFISCLFSLFSVLGRGQSPGTGIHFFQGTWEEAIVKAKTEKKCIFLDAYASWCEPCKTMDREVYTTPEVAKYFNRKFISFRIDMEKGEGPVLAKKLTSIDGYPSLLFFTVEGNLCKTILGSRPAVIFLKEAKLVAD